MAADTTDLTIEILKRIQTEQAGQRQDIRQLQQSFVDIARLIQRMEQRLSDLKPDLETMFKMELIGQHAHQQTRLEQMMDESLIGLEERLSERLARIEARLTP
ncbi:hypothetical protein [Devosia sp.]|uniref:hypothetical protein n=1 Tax=Devosia sp. TaxID=1871048 RepID=UPI001AD10931|nr:hypothetical protein [Devosia sp.]MBN9310269.1 hypothetical protein [Devosia sp.]